MRRIKLLFYGVLTAVVLAIIVGAVVSLFFDLNGLKPTLAEAAREETGRDLAIDGDITLSLFPRPRATATGIRLSNAEGGSEADAITIDAASVQISWFPLLSGTLDVRQVHATGVRVLVEETASGRSSLAFEPTDASPSDSDPVAPPDIIDVRNITIVVRDGDETAYDVEHVTFSPDGLEGPTGVSFAARLGAERVSGTGTLGNLFALGEPAPFPLALSINVGDATLSADGTIRDFDTTPQLDLGIKAAGPSLAGFARSLGADIAATTPFDMAARINGPVDRIRVDEIAFTSGRTALAGSITLDATGERSMVAAAFSSSGIDATGLFIGAAAPEREAGETGDGLLLDDAPLSLGFLRAVDADVTLEAAGVDLLGVVLADAVFSGRVQGGLVEIERLEARLPEGAVRASGQLDARSDTAALTLEAAVSGLDVAEVLDTLNVPARSTRRASASISLSTTGASLREIVVNLTATASLSELEVVFEDAASLVLTDAEARFEGRDKPVAVSARGTLRNEPLRVSGRMDALAGYVPGEPYSFQATIDGGGATLSVETDMHAAMVQGLSARITLEGAKLADLSRMAGETLPEVGPYRASGVLAFAEDRVSLSDARFAIADSNVSGDVALLLDGPIPGIRADLRSERLDLTALAPDPALAGAIAEEAGGSAEDVAPEGDVPFLSAAPFDLAPLFAVTADLRFAAQSLRLDGLTVTDVGVRVVSDGTVLRLEDLSASIDGKTVGATGSLRWTAPQAIVALDAVVGGVDGKALLTSMGVENRIDMGPLDLEVAMRSQGESQVALFDNAELEVVARGFRFTLAPDDVVPHEPVLLDELRIATKGRESPLTATATGKLGAEALEIKATLEPLSRLRLLEPVPMDVVLQTVSSHARITGKAPDRRQPGALDFTVSAEGRILREMASLAGLTLNPEGPWKVEGLLSVADEVVELKQARVAVGGSDLEGTFRVVSANGISLVVARATSKRLNLTDFVPEERPVREESTDEDGPLFDTAPIDLSPLRALDMQLNLEVGQFAGRSVTGGEVSLSAKAKDGVLTIDRFAATLGTGPVIGAASVDAREDAAVVSVSLVGGPFDLGDVLLELSQSAGSENVVDLPVDVDIDLSSRGASPHDLAAAASGKLSLTGGKGQIRQRSFRFLDQGLLRELAPWARDQADRTEINCFVSRFEVDKGVARSTALLLDAQYLSISGQGSVNLGDETLDLTLTPRPKEVRLLDLAVPVSVKGPIADPSIAPTTAGTAKKVVTTLGALVNPLVLLVPVIEGVSAEKNPCLEALERAANGKPAQQPQEGGAVGGVIRGIGEGIEGVGRGIGRILGTDKE